MLLEWTERSMSVRHALLALLSEGPKCGLQLRQEFEARTGEVWPINVGPVTFHLTAEGADELHDWLRTPGGEGRPGLRPIPIASRWVKPGGWLSLTLRMEARGGGCGRSGTAR